MKRSLYYEHSGSVGVFGPGVMILTGMVTALVFGVAFGRFTALIADEFVLPNGILALSLWDRLRIGGGSSGPQGQGA